MPKANREQIRAFEMPLPPIELQNRFADIVQRVEKHREKLNAQLDDAEQLFKSLQQSFFR